MNRIFLIITMGMAMFASCKKEEITSVKGTTSNFHTNISNNRMIFKDTAEFNEYQKWSYNIYHK